MNSSPLSLKTRIRLFRGVLRRQFNNLFRPGYVQKNRLKRVGECHRCGACCQLAWRCSYLQKVDGISSCSIHDRMRPPNCVTFPIDSKDLADRDLIAPQIPCGFSWDT